jgi:small subunit ribosomal protein S5
MAEEKNKQTIMSKTTKAQAERVEEHAEAVLNVRRVAKVIKGGRRLAFSALVVVGDRKGSVGVALGKSREVSSAIAKALRRARKTMFPVPMYKTTVPFSVKGKHGASEVILRSASKGTGVIAGGAVRAILEALGVRDVLAKSVGPSTPHNVAMATFDALKKLRTAKQIAELRGKTLKDLFGDKNVAAS